MAENVDTSQLEGSLKTISRKFRCITIRKESENNMKRYFGIFCAAVMLFALMAVPMASAESAAQQKEVNTTIDLDSMNELPSGEVSAPYAVWTACGEASTAAPYSLVADDNGGKMVKYTLTGDPIMRHILAFNVTAVPYSSVSVTFRTKTDETLRPLIEAYSPTTGKRLGYMNTAKNTEFTTYTFNFMMNADSSAVVKIALGNSLEKGAESGKSYAGTAFLDDISVVTSPYNLIIMKPGETVQATGGMSYPIGVSGNGNTAIDKSGTPTGYYTIEEDGGLPVFHYKNNNKVLSGGPNFILDFGYDLPADTVFHFDFAAKMPVDPAGANDLRIKFYAVGSGNNTIGACLPDSDISPSDWETLGLFSDSGFFHTATNSLRMGMSKDGASLFKSYQSASLKLTAPAGTRYIRVQFALGESVDRSAKGEFYIKNPRLYLPETQAIVNANDFYSTGVLSDTVINVAQLDLADQGFTVTSKNNPVSTLLLNDKSLLPGSDYTVTSESSDAQSVYTVKFSAAAAKAVKENDIIKVQMADGTVLNIAVVRSFTGFAKSISVKDKNGNNLLTDYVATKNDYTISTTSETISLNVAAMEDNTTIQVNGEAYTADKSYALTEGDNTFVITLLVEDEVTGTYTVKVTKTKESVPGPSTGAASAWGSIAILAAATLPVLALTCKRKNKRSL